MIPFTFCQLLSMKNNFQIQTISYAKYSIKDSSHQHQRHQIRAASAEIAKFVLDAATSAGWNLKK